MRTGTQRAARRTTNLLRALSFLTALLLAPTALAATLTICPRWPYSYYDNISGSQEDGLKHLSGQNYGVQPASYAYATLTRNGTAVLPAGFLNSSGCFAPVDFVAGTYVVTLTSYAKKSSGPRFEVRQTAASGSYTQFQKAISYSPSGGNLTSSFIITNTIDAVTNSMAAATQFLRESHIGLDPANTHRIIVNSSLGWAQAQGFNAHLSTYQGINDASWKYVIGHEVGHTVQNPLFGLLSSNYGLDTTAPNICNCSHIPDDPVGDPNDYNDDHCLQSREHGGSAQNEGWGHFIALDLMNDDTQSDGFFTYYKEIRCPSVVNTVAIPGCPTANQIVPPPRSVNGRHQHRWMQTRCSTTAYRGTEIDWMNFYFATHSTGGSNQFFFTQFRDTYRGACGGGSCAGVAVTWSQLVASVTALYSIGRRDHWLNMGTAFGVNQ